MNLHGVATAPAPHIEPRGVEITTGVNVEPTTSKDWKRLAQLLKSARPEDYPQIERSQFEEFKRYVMKYAGGWDFLPWAFLMLLVVVGIVVINGRVDPDLRIPLAILETLLAIIIPVRWGIAHRNLRTNALAMGWAIGFFKLS